MRLLVARLTGMFEQRDEYAEFEALVRSECWTEHAWLVEEMAVTHG